MIDKTGTLTEGKPELTDLVAVEGMTEDRLLQLAAGLEQGSEHPLAAAILEAAKRRGIEDAAATDFKATTGMGVGGVIKGKSVGLGNAAMMEALGADPTASRPGRELAR